jgi:uncharacterized membrane protein HdeD (DUF308 family)
MSSLLTAVLGLLLVAATVVGIVTAVRDSQRPSVGFQSHSGVVLYGGR